MSSLKTITPGTIETEEDYEAALAHISSLMDALPDTPAEAELELWASLIQRYEKRHFPVLPDNLPPATS
jgi:HTH-type transcriptional regulator/antitoxin HigA